MKLPGLSNLFRQRSSSKSPQQSTWQHDLPSKDGWRTVRNPELGDTQKQRRAKLVLIGVLGALPLSLIALLVAGISAANSGQEAPVVVQEVSLPWEARQQGAAEIHIFRELEGSGYEVRWARSTSQREAALGCGQVFCERHTVVADVGTAEVLVFDVVVDPRTGNLRGPLQLTGTGEESLPRNIGTWGETWPQSVSLPEDIEVVIDMWATAFVSGDATTLQRLSGLEEQQVWDVHAPGWEYEQGSAVWQEDDWANNGDGEILLTVSFDIFPQNTENCYAGLERDRLEDNLLPACPAPITVGRDVRILGGAGLTTRVIGSSPPGEVDLLGRTVEDIRAEAEIEAALAEAATATATATPTAEAPVSEPDTPEPTTTADAQDFAEDTGLEDQPESEGGNGAEEGETGG